jgi:hypothetical protein
MLSTTSHTQAATVSLAARRSAPIAETSRAQSHVDRGQRDRRIEPHPEQQGQRAQREKGGLLDART